MRRPSVCLMGVQVVSPAWLSACVPMWRGVRSHRWVAARRSLWGGVWVAHMDSVLAGGAKFMRVLDGFRL
jgi:hypothetical protein